MSADQALLEQLAQQAAQLRRKDEEIAAARRAITELMRRNTELVARVDTWERAAWSPRGAST